MKVASVVAASLEITGSLERQPRLGRRGQVGCSSDQPGYTLGDGVENFSRRDPRGDALGIGRMGGQVFVPAVGKLPVLNPVEVIGKRRILGLVIFKPGKPGVAQLLATAADALLEMIVDSVGNEELCILGPAVKALGQPD